MLVGIALGRVKHWYAGDEYWIDELGIAPEEQGRGVGTVFIESINQFLKARGVKRMVLLTDRDVPAYNFYIKNGFDEVTNNVCKKDCV